MEGKHMTTKHNEETRYIVRRKIRDDMHGHLQIGALPSRSRVSRWSENSRRAMIKQGFLEPYGGDRPCDPDPPSLARPAAAVPVDRPPSATAPDVPSISQPAAEPAKASIRIERKPGRPRKELP